MNYKVIRVTVNRGLRGMRQLSRIEIMEFDNEEEAIRAAGILDKLSKDVSYFVESAQ